MSEPSALPTPCGAAESPLNGQALLPFAAARYGLGTIGHCGCEVIAVYNALLCCGVPQPFAAVMRYMRRYAALFGLWGTIPLALGHCLRHFGLRTKRLRTHRAVAAALSAGTHVVYVYWTRRRFCSAIHTVCMTQTDGTLQVLNAYSNLPHALETTVENYLRGRRQLLAYAVNPPDDTPERGMMHE